jgi:hypothetical protein
MMHGGVEKGEDNGEKRVSVFTTTSGVQVFPEPVRPHLDADCSIDPQRYSFAVVPAAFIEHWDCTPA